MARSRCLVCHQLRCDHQGQARRTRSAWSWTQHSRTLIAEHVTDHGWWCPGLDDHMPHDVQAGDLTVHHLDQLAGTGEDTGRHVVLCRSENSRIG